MKGLLEENKTYFISNFEVKENSKDYKATPHEFKLLFSASTFINEQISEINVNPFHFVPLSDVVKAEESAYPDYLIGNIFLEFLSLFFFLFLLKLIYNYVQM